MKKIQLVITEACNASCEFCYSLNRPTYMDRETFDNYYQSLPDFDYTLEFFGGEPLMNWEFIVYVVDKLKGDSRFKEFVIYSNGLLLDEAKADFIRANNITFLWSWKDNNYGQLPNINILREVAKEIRVLVTPTIIDFVGIHKAVYDSTGRSPSFRVIRDNVWDDRAVALFRKNFFDYMKFLIDNPSQISTSTYRKTEYIFKCTQGMQRPRCHEVRENDCLAPDGRSGLCYKMVAEDTVDCYSDDLYIKCMGCEIQHICERGCYQQVLINGSPYDGLCTVYKIMFNGIIMLDKELTKRRYEPWMKFVKTLVM